MVETPDIVVRPYAAEDAAFLAAISDRLIPRETASPRDRDAFRNYFASLATGGLLAEPGAEAFVASIAGRPMGVIALHPDVDYFTGHPRAYVDILVVAQEGEGKGVGRTLMTHAEDWARAHGCIEVVLDVFAKNAGAIAFYQRCGYQTDHLRMAKRLD